MYYCNNYIKIFEKFFLIVIIDIFFFDLCGLFIYKGFLCRKKIIYCNLIIFLFLINIGKFVLEYKFCLF